MNDRKELFGCECSSLEHMVVVTVLYNEDATPDFCLQVTADQHLLWYQRILPAIKFLFGQPSLKWHDVMLSREDVYKLHDCTSDYIRETLEQM